MNSVDLEYQDWLSERKVLRTRFLRTDVFLGLAKCCVGCKYVWVTFIDTREAKLRTLSLLRSHLAWDGICVLREAPGSLCVCFHGCNCVHPNYASSKCNSTFSMPASPSATTLLLGPPSLWLLHSISVSTYLSQEGKSITNLCTLGISSLFFPIWTAWCSDSRGYGSVFSQGLDSECGGMSS